MIEDLESMEGDRWKLHDKFLMFKTTLNTLSQNEQQQQTTKLAYFLQYIRKSITKHFKDWTERLFFLSIFSDQPIAKIIANKIVGGKEVLMNGSYYCKFHKRRIDLPKLHAWVQTNVSTETIMSTILILCIQDNDVAVRLLPVVCNMWDDDTTAPLYKLKTVFLNEFAAFPTNTQFAERGVKESGYVSLGRRGERNRTIMAIARGKVLPDALQLGQKDLDTIQPEEDEEEQETQKKRQLKGKRKVACMMNSMISNINQVAKMKDDESQEYGENHYNAKRRRVKELLTDDSIQFKKERINKKVEHLKSKYHHTPTPNQYQRREGYTLTPLMQGKIQYGLLKKDKKYGCGEGRVGNAECGSSTRRWLASYD